MKTQKNNNQHADNKSRKFSILPYFAGFVLTSLFSSCAAIASIFKAGMGFGIFIVVAVIVGIMLLVVRSGKK